MKAPFPDPRDRAALAWSLLAGEVLARRGQPGPLARVWIPAPRRRPAARQVPADRSTTAPDRDKG